MRSSLTGLIERPHRFEMIRFAHRIDLEVIARVDDDRGVGRLDDRRAHGPVSRPQRRPDRTPAFRSGRLGSSQTARRVPRCAAPGSAPLTGSRGRSQCGACDLGTQHEAVNLHAALREDVHRAERFGVLALEGLVDVEHVALGSEPQLRRRRAVDVDLPAVFHVELETEPRAGGIVALPREVLPRPRFELLDHLVELRVRGARRLGVRREQLDPPRRFVDVRPAASWKPPTRRTPPRTGRSPSSSCRACRHNRRSGSALRRRTRTG